MYKWKASPHSLYIFFLSSFCCGSIPLKTSFRSKAEYTVSQTNSVWFRRIRPHMAVCNSSTVDAEELWRISLSVLHHFRSAAHKDEAAVLIKTFSGRNVLITEVKRWMQSLLPPQPDPCTDMSVLMQLSHRGFMSCD